MSKNQDCRCLICNRPIKNPKTKEIKMGRTCAKKYFFENRGSLSDIYEKIKNDVIADTQTSLSPMNIGQVDNDYVSMLYQVPLKDPGLYVSTIIQSCKPTLNKILKENPSFGGRTDVEMFFEIPESIIKQHNDLEIGKKAISDLFEKMNLNFALFIQKSLYSGDATMMDAQTHGVREFINSINIPGASSKVGPFKELKINEIYKGDDVPDEKAKIVIKALKTVSTLIPDEYKKKIPPVTVLIRGESSEQASAASLNGDSYLVLNVRNNNIVQSAEAFHEYVHLVETFNPEIMKFSNAFLKKRRIKKERTTLKKIGEKYNKHFKEVAAGIEVYEDHFTDAYAGRTYGDLDGKKPVPSEVLTVGCEALVLDPIGFAIKDKEYFDFVVKFLKGKI